MRLGTRIYTNCKPLVMAIINVTPDSFYADSRACDESAIRAAVARAVSEGADLLDIGACSTRPAVQQHDKGMASEQQEWQRLHLALQVIRDMDVDIPVSVDTFRHEVAKRALNDYGVAMINDISGGGIEMYELVASFNCAYVLTYNRSKAEHTTGDVLCDAIDYLSRKADILHRMGVSDVVIDPGFGFGQTVNESLCLLRDLHALQHIGSPVLVGISRKRMAYEPHHLTPDNCLEQTLQLERLAIQHGAAILRVHDVAATRQMLTNYNIQNTCFSDSKIL